MSGRGRLPRRSSPRRPPSNGPFRPNDESLVHMEVSENGVVSYTFPECSLEVRIVFGNGVGRLTCDRNEKS